MKAAIRPAVRPPLSGEWPIGGAFALAVLAWFFPLGLIFGWHWWVLYACAARSPAERSACVIHFCFHIVALLLTGGGGWYVRSEAAGYIQCTTAGGVNISMSQECLWTQPSRYISVYVMHFIGGGWLLSAWVLDAVQIPLWTLRRQPMTTLYSASPLFPHYAIVLLVSLICVSLTWTTIVQWDDSSVGILAAGLVGLILVVGTIAAVALRFLPQHQRCAPSVV